MLFDFATAQYSSSQKVVQDLTKEHIFESTATACDFWEEHCVECGAPYCYATCDKFIQANDGRCRRFAQGIQPVADMTGHNAVAIQFLPWGKLELYFRGRMVLPRTAAHIAWLQNIMVHLSRLINPLFSWLPYTRNPIAIWRSVRRFWIARQKGVAQSPTHWIFQVVTEQTVELAASIFNEKQEEVFVRRLTLKPGANKYIFDVPPVGNGSCFRIFSIRGTDVPVCFTQLELACGTLISSARDASAKFVKCVAWDLDNTLWNGILAEDGPEGVSLRHEVVELIKRLDARGILNTICSKNDWEPVKNQLKKYGLLEYFIFPEVNWGPKSESLKRAALNINIGLDTFAFVDDSEYERGEVAAHCPQVRVYSDQDIWKIAVDPSFNPPVSAESAKRRFSYLAEMQRHAAESAKNVSRIEFLRDCNIHLTCGALTTNDLKKRCWELVNRTNQLTLAANRYTESEFEKLVADGEAYAVHCADKYGDYGIVGFIAFEYRDKIARVSEFVMSCRVAKKLCEQSVLLFMAEKFKASGVAILDAEVKPTGRNVALIEAFDAMPFAKCQMQSGLILYTLRLNDSEWDGVYRNKVTIGEIAL